MRSIYRREALIRSAQPEALDDLLCVTAPHERFFQRALVIALVVVGGGILLAL